MNSGMQEIQISSHTTECFRFLWCQLSRLVEISVCWSRGVTALLIYSSMETCLAAMACVTCKRDINTYSLWPRKIWNQPECVDFNLKLPLHWSRVTDPSTIVLEVNSIVLTELTNLAVFAFISAQQRHNARNSPAIIVSQAGSLFLFHSRSVTIG